MAEVDLTGFGDRIKSKGLGRDQVAAEVSRNLKAAGMDFPKARVREVLDEALRVIETAMLSGKRVELRGFGTIQAHRRGVRRSFVPSKGKIQRVDAKWVVKFSTSKDLKKRLMQTLEK